MNVTWSTRFNVSLELFTATSRLLYIVQYAAAAKITTTTSFDDEVQVNN
jgi:hypothetical protein